MCILQTVSFFKAALNSSSSFPVDCDIDALEQLQLKNEPLSLPVLKGLLMRVHYPKLRNIVHPISLLMFLLLPKDQTFIFYL